MCSTTPQSPAPETPAPPQSPASPSPAEQSPAAPQTPASASQSSASPTPASQTPAPPSNETPVPSLIDTPPALPLGDGTDASAKQAKPRKVPQLGEDKPEDITVLKDGLTQFLIEDKDVEADVFSSTDFGSFEPPKKEPTPPPKRVRKTKEQREKEKAEKEAAAVPPHLSNPAENFRYRILMARIMGPEEMKSIEEEIENNFQKGENDKNTAAIQQGLLQTQWRLRPLGFHSKWLWSLARKYCGDDFSVKYLIQTRKNLHSWYLFISTRQLLLWRDCVDDLITTAKESLEAKKISVYDLLDVIGVYHVDTSERNQYTYLEDQITGYKAPHPAEKVKLLQENLDDKYLAELYCKLVVDFQDFMKLCTEEQFLDLLRPAMERMTEEDKEIISKAMDKDEALEIRHMPIVRELFGLPAKPRPLPPPFVPPPEPPKPKVLSEF